MTLSTEEPKKKFIVLTNKADSAGGSSRYALDIAHILHNKGQLTTILAKSRARWLNLALGMPLCSFRLNWLPLKLDCLVFSIVSWWFKKTNPETLLFACTEVLFPDIIACGLTHKGYLRALKKKPSFKEKIELFYEAQAYKNATSIVAHSSLVRQELVELYGVSENKIALLHPPVKRIKFYNTDHPSARAWLASELGIDLKNKVTFLFPSMIHKLKGIDHILAALANFKKDAILLIAGKKQGIQQENVVELGLVQDMEKLYPCCDYTILASSYEAFGLVGVESVLCGTPVILSNQCGCNEVLSKEVRINFEASDQEELNSVIATAIKKPFRVVNPEENIFYDLSFDHHIQSIIERYKRLSE